MKTKAVSGIMLTLLVFYMLSVNMIGITLGQEDHDIAVVSVAPYPTKAGLGELVNVTVTVENQGTENENFFVTVYYDGTTIETQNVVNQAPNTNKTLTFVWNTTGMTAGTYSINATASAVLNETDTTDNTLTLPIDVVSPYIAVRPRSTLDLTSTPGQNYTVSIYTNYNGSDIWGYEFTVTYNPLVLQGVEVVNGDLITREGTIFIAGAFNNTLGTLSLPGAIAVSSDIPPEPLNSTGPGILANVTFKIVGLGESSITLGSETKLKDMDGTNIIDYLDDLDSDPTRGKFLHGHFQNAPEEVHDVTVTSIELYPESVKRGELVTINVTIRNKGTATEGVRVKIYYGFDKGTGQPLYLIGSPKTLNIESAADNTISFIWNTTAASVGTHPITAVAQLLGGLTDINPDDNMLKIDDAVEVRARARHDIAITNITPLPTTVKIGEPVSINVTVVNQGTEKETFDVTVYYDDTTIDTQTVTELASDTSQSLLFNWDTTGVTPGNYTISAVADSVPGETDTTENTFTYGDVALEEAPAPDILLYVAAAGVVAIVIAALAIYFLKIRKPKPT